MKSNDSDVRKHMLIENEKFVFSQQKKNVTSFTSFDDKILFKN